MLEVQPVRSALALSARVVPPAATASATTAALKVAAVKPLAKKHAILFFTASWCPSCVQMKSQTLPYVSLPGHDLRVIDADANPQLMQSYGVQSLPSYIVLDGTGRPYKHGVGFRDVRQFVDFLNPK